MTNTKTYEAVLAAAEQAKSEGLHEAETVLRTVAGLLACGTIKVLVPACLGIIDIMQRAETEKQIRKN